MTRAFAFCLLAFLVVSAPMAGADDREDTPSPVLPERAVPEEADPVPDPAPDAVPAVRDVGEVQVVTSRNERENLETPGNVTVLDREDIVQSGAKDVPDLLRREAGLYVTNDITSPDGYRVQARGFNNGQGNDAGMLVLVDGRRVNEGTTGFVDWGLIFIDDVEEIHIVRGPASAVYGDNAEAGVISIRTRPTGGPARVEFLGRAGTYDLLEGSLVAQGGYGPVGAKVFLNRWATDNYRDRSAWLNQSVDVRLDALVRERTRIDFAGGYLADSRERPGSLTQAEIDSLGRRAASPASVDDFGNVRQTYVQAGLESVLAEGVTLDILPYYRRRSAGSTSTTLDMFSSSLFSTDRVVTSLGTNGRLEVDREIGGHRNRLILGGDYLREHVKDESSGQIVIFGIPNTVIPLGGKTDSTRYVYGVFAQNELNLTEKLIASAGIRWDKGNYFATDDFSRFDSDFSQWSPKAALVYRLLEWMSAYGSYARGFRMPNFDEAFGFFGFAPGLDPETSVTYETGLKVRRPGLSLNAAIYHMDVTREILLNSEVQTVQVTPSCGFPPCPNPLNQNIGRIRHRGFEFSGNWQPLEWLELYGSYTWDDTKFQLDGFDLAASDASPDLRGNTLPITPEHRGTTGFVVYLPFGNQLGMNGNFVSRRYVANDLTNTLDKLPGYAVVDAHWRVTRQLGEHVELGGGFVVRNLFGSEYDEVAGERLFSPGLVGFFPAPGRSYEVKLMVRLTR